MKKQRGWELWNHAGDFMELHKKGIYEKYIKRGIDILCALAAVVGFSWLYLLLMLSGAIMMRGNPFFVQERVGKDEKVFKLIKFRSMDNRRGKDGKLLSDEVRLNAYGRFLRKTSLDEIPEAFNILKGDMSVVGPRPLLVQYLPYYTDAEKHRHDVRPGLTGLAQVNGRNSIGWEDKFRHDVDYVRRISLIGDMRIVFLTVWNTLRKRDIGERGVGILQDFDTYRKNQQKGVR